MPKKSIEKDGLLPFFCLISVFIPIYLSAWAGDDAFISLRSVRHFLEGYGWRYNIAERVQTFTNPLLTLCMTVAAAITREYYFTLLFLNLAASAAALYLLFFREEKSTGTLIFCCVLPIFSVAFKDFATSGLENSFGYLLSALFFSRFFSEKEFDGGDVFFLSLMTGLTLLNRMDTVLTVFPALAYACLKCRKDDGKRLLYLVPAGLTPFILWECFCLIYYGFPFPNSFYAKLQTGFPFGEYLIRGVRYYEYTFLFDPVTLFGIAAGLTAMFYKPADGRFVAAGTGIVLYLLYILYIGGDFMGGRFFALPFFIAVFLFPYGRINPDPKKTAIILMLPLILTVRNFKTEGVELSCLFKTCKVEKNQIANERYYYKDFAEFFFVKRQWGDFPIPMEFFSKQTGNALVYTTAGIVAFSKPETHIVDIFGLVDPLMTRLPAIHQEGFRIGHVIRPLPGGYPETLRSGKNLIKDKEIADYYEKLKEVVSAPLFSAKRFKTIWELNVRKRTSTDFPFRTEGFFSKDKEEIYKKLGERESFSLIKKIKFSLLKKDLKKYTAFTYFIYPILVELDDLSHASYLTLDVLRSTESCPRLGLYLINSKDGEALPVYHPFSPRMKIPLPEQARTKGFDRILLFLDHCPGGDTFFLKDFDLTD